MDRFDDIIDYIISLEWDMFQAVNEGGPRASCQEDRTTFEGMRRGQLEAWSDVLLKSYMDDLLNAILDNRNLITEKYIHMMKNASPEQYKELIQLIPMPDDDIVWLAQDISNRMVTQTVVLFNKYPRVTGSGRPLYAYSDGAGVVSIETYQFGELLTYSERTLSLLKNHFLSLESEGRSLAGIILENTVKHYGYKTLMEAENAMSSRFSEQNL